MLCPTCNQDKPQNKSEPVRTKAHGFYDWQCWDCYRHDVQARAQRRQNTIQSPKLIELQTKLHELQTAVKETKAQMLLEQQTLKQQAQQSKIEQTKLRQSAREITSTKVLNVPYHVREAQAKRALELFEQANTNQHNAELKAYRAQLQCALDCIQAKIKKFGPDAFDFAKTNSPD